MNGNTPINPSLTSRVRWNAIFAGVFIATTVGALLNLFGIGIGLTNLDLDPDTISAISIGSIVWWAIAGTIAMFIGGWVTARLSNISNRTDSILNALTTWSLATVLGLLFVGTTAGMVISGTADLIGEGLSAAGQAASQVAPVAASSDSVGNAVSQINAQVEQLVDQASSNIKKNGGTVAEANQEFSQALNSYLNADDQNSQQQAQQQLASVMAKYTSLSKDQANQKIQKWQQLYQQAEQKAAQTTEQAGDVLGSVAIGGFAILLLGGFAAAFGGVLGGRSKRDY
jgi:uncharacterized membrane protein